MTEFIKTDERIDTVHNYWIDPDSREIWIHSVDVSGPGYDGEEPGVEYNMAIKVIKNLHYLRKKSTRARVTIHLHSAGGNYQEGMSIFDTIRLMSYPVTMISYTQAESMSSILLQAATGPNDTRLVMPHSYFMFHYGEIATAGGLSAVETEIEFSKIQKKEMIDIYVDAVNGSPKFKEKSPAQIRKFLENCMEKKGDVYLTSKETVEWGFADGIVEHWPNHAKWTRTKD